jgi:hypothetical protein
VVPNQKDGIIFTRDPINNLIAESKLYPYDIISNTNTADSLNSNNIQMIHENDDNNLKFYNSKRKSQNKYHSYNLNENNLISATKNQNSHSLINLYSNSNYSKPKLTLRRDDSILNDNIYRLKKHKVIMRRPTHQTNSYLKPKTIIRKKEETPTRALSLHPLMIAPLIRRSLLDLHQKTLENNGSNQKSKINLFRKVSYQQLDLNSNSKIQMI